MLPAVDAFDGESSPTDSLTMRRPRPSPQAGAARRNLAGFGKPSLTVFLVAMFVAGAAEPPIFAGDEIGLIRIGEPWRYTLDLPPAGWQQPEFEDSGWGEAPSAFTFAYSGYEASSLATPGRPYGAVFFRRRFAVPDPAAIQWLVLRLDWSGGGVVWLNGVEVLRQNLPGAPGDPVEPTYRPPLQNRTGPQLIDLSAWRELLRREGNCLAIEWHEHSTGGYASALAMELLANFTRGPALQAAAPGRQTIMWQTPIPTEGWVEYGPGDALTSRSASTPVGTNHQMTLENLGPGRLYSYRVVARSPDGRTAATVPRAFRVFNSAGPVRFAVTADVGTGRTLQYAMARVLRQAVPDLVLMPGDLVYPQFNRNRADFRWFSVYAEHLRSTPYFVVAGNHDVTYASDHSFLEHFAMPENGPLLRERPGSGAGPEGHWAYSFDCGDVHFVGLYVPILLPDYDLPEDSEQIAWLEQDLAASNRPWKVVFLHHPLFSSGPHGRDDFNGNGWADTLELGARLLPVFQAHGVQLVFSGHDHIYERHTPWQGIQTIVTGAGGGSLYPIYRQEPTSVYALSHSHLTLVTIDGAEAELRALDPDGRELDRAWYRREPPPADVLWTAAWHTPADPTPLPPDGDGNRLGQIFDLRGEPIPGVTGRFAHPGRLRVDVDETFVHLGVEGMALPEGDDLILFVGVEGRPGITAMEALVEEPPPAGSSGAEALGWLGNVGFADGFEPLLACVLGDEFADGTDRFFERPRVVVMGEAGETNTWVQRPTARGQGVFRLAIGFPEVAGARVEQFNRSPQQESSLQERSANYAVVSIPRTALGLDQEDILQLAGLVVRADPPARSLPAARWLDGAFIGSSLLGRGFAAAQLAPVRVRQPARPLRLKADRLGAATLRLRWRGAPRALYRVESTADLNEPFLPLPDPAGLVEADEAGMAEARLPAPAGTGFYRVRRLP